MFWRILRILMWRHWLSRKRQFICTGIECVVPLLVFLPLFLFRQDLFDLGDFPEDESLDGVFRARQPEVKKIVKPKPSSLINVQDLPFVIYTPETNFTRELMSMVGKQLDLQLLNTSLTGKAINGVRGYFPLANDSTLIKYIKNLGPNEAAVVFHNVSGLSRQDRLNYTIRMNSPFKTNEILSDHDNAALIRLLTNSHTETYYDEVYEPFIRLQWAIDSSFIQMLTGKEVKQKVTLKEFRAKDWKKSVGHILLWLMKVVCVYLACGLAMISIFYGFMSRMLIEKASGIQELMKMMGVTSKALIVSHVLNSLVPGLIYSIGATVLMKIGRAAIMEHAQCFLVFLMFFLHYFSLISMGMVFSYLGSRASNPGLTVFLVYFGMTMPAFILLMTSIKDQNVIHLCGIIFVVPLTYCLKEISALEITGEGLNFKTMMNVNGFLTSSALVAYIFFIVQIVICWFLCWYFEHVLSGYMGSALPWNFLCTKSYWEKTPSEPYVKTRETQAQESQTKLEYFEPPPENIEAGIKVINVTKDYPKNPGALDNLSLDVYKGEITILLGHNGAGKSTLMSVITGMTGATNGKVLVNGFDVLLQKEQARKHLGLCPQQNMFMQNVSVIEHVMFFALIKKGTFREARKSSEEILDSLKIREKADNDTSELSGGMKRRVQLACALAGDASVLLLDEPTSGLDVETRRSLWDMLLSFRGARTVLLTTHFMEEADALGDRVALLHSGKLRSYGTSLYLKRAVGAGYRLTVTTSNEPNEEAITSTITSVIPDATVKGIGFNSISYNLPLANIKNFPNLFSKLESKKSELGIDSIGVGASTLEEVFLRLCSDYTVSPVAATPPPAYQKLTGMPLWRRQLIALIKRYLRFLWIYKITQIGYGIIIISACIFLTTMITNEIKRTKGETLRARTLNMDNPSTDARIMYKVNGNNCGLKMLRRRYPRVLFENVSDIDKAVLRAGRRSNKKEHSDYLAAIEINDTDAKVFYKNVNGHAAAAALNLLANLLAAQPHANLRTGGLAITTHNHPLSDKGTPLRTMFQTPKSDDNIFKWSLMITILILTGVLCMLTLPSKDYNSGVRLNHLLAGCRPELHWASLLLAVTFQVLVTYVLAIIIACAAVDRDNTFTDVRFLFMAGLVVLLGSVASLTFACFVTFHFSENLAARVVVANNVLWTLLFPLLMTMWASPFLKTAALIFIPSYTFLEALNRCTKVASLNAYCKLNKDKCPMTDILSMHFEGGKCCGSPSNPVSYLSFSLPSPGMQILLLFVQIIICMTLLCLKQRCMFSWLWERSINNRYKEPALRYNDENIKMEQAYVKNAIELPTKNIPDILLVSNVHKNYYQCVNQTFNAVRGVSFSVKKGECFGLLGVNGAGKSSMFQMLAVDQCTTRGRIFANGHLMKIPCHDKYLKSLAYCPQFRGLDDFLTGRQNLDVMLTMKGLNARDSNIEALAWIKLVALEKYSDRIVAEYSGGCNRRMAAAAALCTGAPVSMLDEPTSGVDVVARRAVWYALERALHEQRAVIITSHSIDETEWLCHRVAIMAGGEVCALGSPAALRAAYAQGHYVIFKLKHISETDDTAQKQMEQLKSTIENKFNCELKDQHKTMLHYHINETMNYSKIFQELEQIQSSSSGLVEDYSVSETTLEEVFISFARSHEEATTNKTKGKKDSKTEGKSDGKTEGKSDGNTKGKRDSKTEGKSDGKTGGKSDGKTEGKRDATTDSKPKKSDKKSGPGPRK